MLYSIPCCFYTCCFRLSKNWQYKQIRNNLFVHCMQQLTTSQMDPKIPDFIYSSKLEDENLESLNLWPRSVFWEANVSNFPLSMHFLAQIPLCYQWWLLLLGSCVMVEVWSITHFALKSKQKLLPTSTNYLQQFESIDLVTYNYTISKINSGIIIFNHIDDASSFLKPLKISKKRLPMNAVAEEKWSKKGTIWGLLGGWLSRHRKKSIFHATWISLWKLAER